MLSHNNLNLILWGKLTPSEQSFYLEGYIKHLGIDTDKCMQTPDEMFKPDEDKVT